MNSSLLPLRILDGLNRGCEDKEWVKPDLHPLNWNGPNSFPVQVCRILDHPGLNRIVYQGMDTGYLSFPVFKGFEFAWLTPGY